MVCLQAGAVQPGVGIVYPRPNQVIGIDDVESHKLVVWQEGFTYLPQLAVPTSQWGNGVSVLGDPIVFGEGHVHGWLFKVGSDKEITLPLNSAPVPGDYLRFYGANWTSYAPWGEKQGYITRVDNWSNLEPGLYEFRIGAQNHDHTALRQPTAPAYQAPVENIVRFRLVKRGK